MVCLDGVARVARMRRSATGGRRNNLEQWRERVARRIRSCGRRGRRDQPVKVVLLLTALAVLSACGIDGPPSPPEGSLDGRGSNTIGVVGAL